MMPPAPQPQCPAHFLVGTDTEVGKTYVTCALLHRARMQGLQAVGMKPVAAGADVVDGAMSNGDARALLAASSALARPDEINPYCLPDPIAPHVAAAEAGVSIRPQPILAALSALRSRADWVLVEGVGGFRVPLGTDWDTADLAELLRLPVILVVGLRLGCLSHALLTAEAIERHKLRLAGWVANHIDPHMLRQAQNVDALHERLTAPLLGVLPYAPQGTKAEAAARLILPDLAS